ncbi:hypothetical protein RUM43_007785 [Polyplax serrata]|uniref:Putative hydroxypyruvate isomerase n=1 Tax=Polyplax serrata TaxID=468196 RepID=A0AAN8S830_POLSC
MVLKFCSNLSFMFQESGSLLERYELARQAGFKAVECAFPYDYAPQEIAQAKTKAGVQQVLINSYPGNWERGERGLAAVPGKSSEFKASIEQAIDYAKKLDCKRIHIMSGVIETEAPEHLMVYRSNLNLAEKMLRENDIVGVIEPINKYSLPNYFLNDYKKATSIIKEIDSPHIRLQLDLFHMQQICGNLTKNLQNLLPFVGHIQVAQVPDRHEPNTPGEINYKYVYDLLEKLGYDGWIGLEYTPKKKTTEGLNWLTEYGYSL